MILFSFEVVDGVFRRGFSDSAGNGGDFGFARGKAKARVSLFSASCAFVEDGSINFGDNDVITAAEISRSRGGGER